MTSQYEKLTQAIITTSLKYKFYVYYFSLQVQLATWLELLATLWSYPVMSSLPRMATNFCLSFGTKKATPHRYTREFFPKSSQYIALISEIGKKNK